MMCYDDDAKVKTRDKGTWMGWDQWGDYHNGICDRKQRNIHEKIGVVKGAKQVYRAKY